MAPVELYVNWSSTPSRAVAMACHIANIDVRYTIVDLFKGEQNKPEYLKINYDHCVPTLVDGDFTLWESRAVAKYLLDKFSPDHELFPKDLQKRAHINRMLDFDLGVVSKAVGAYVYPRAFPTLFKSEPSTLDELEVMLKRLNDTVFHNTSYAIGDVVTLADLFIISSLTFAEIIGYKVPAEKFPNLGAWMTRMKATDFYATINVEYEKIIAELQAKK